MADEPDRDEIQTIRDALTRCAEQIRETVEGNDALKGYRSMSPGYQYSPRMSEIIANFISLKDTVITMLGVMSREFVGGIENLIQVSEKLKFIIFALKSHGSEYLSIIRDSCIGYIEEVIQLFDEQIRRLHEAQRGGRRKTRTKKIKKQTRRSRSRSRSRSKSRSRRN
jgi:hypothetical protein